MTQREFIDTIRNIVGPVDKTGRFHPAQIKAVCDVVYSSLMFRINDVTVGDLDIYSKEYTSQTVTLDATKNLYYTTLPVAIVPIPGVCSGVRKINTNQGLDLDFASITELEIYYLDGSAAQTTDTTIWYWLQGSKIWYNESMTAAIAAAGVRIVLLPRFSAFSDSDTISIPGASDLEFVGQVLQILGYTAPVDLKANNA